MEITNFKQFILAKFPNCPDIIEDDLIFSTPGN